MVWITWIFLFLLNLCKAMSFPLKILQIWNDHILWSLRILLHLSWTFIKEFLWFLVTSFHASNPGSESHCFLCILMKRILVIHFYDPLDICATYCMSQRTSSAIVKIIVFWGFPIFDPVFSIIVSLARFPPPNQWEGLCSTQPNFFDGF